MVLLIQVVLSYTPLYLHQISTALKLREKSNGVLVLNSKDVGIFLLLLLLHEREREREGIALMMSVIGVIL